MLYRALTVSVHEHDKVIAFYLYGLYNGAPLDRPYSKCLLFFPPYSHPQELSNRLEQEPPG